MNKRVEVRRVEIFNNAILRFKSQEGNTNFWGSLSKALLDIGCKESVSSNDCNEYEKIVSIIAPFYEEYYKIDSFGQIAKPEEVLSDDSNLEANSLVFAIDKEIDLGIRPKHELDKLSSFLQNLKSEYYETENKQNDKQSIRKELMEMWSKLETVYIYSNNLCANLSQLVVQNFSSNAHEIGIDALDAYVIKQLSEASDAFLEKILDGLTILYELECRPLACSDIVKITLLCSQKNDENCVDMLLSTLAKLNEQNALHEFCDDQSALNSVQNLRDKLLGLADKINYSTMEF